jgi:DNA invertase Pin-like site-specific DNA recombinase
MKKAIAYIRFSSDDQADGNSIVRQTGNIEGYCKHNGLALTETLIDDGFSAFKGHHVLKGKLGKFLEEAKSGKYAGYALVIEQMDRLSRQGIEETFKLQQDILAAGIEVHITQSNRVIRSLDDMATAILSVVDSYAAQEYSKKLRERIGKAWRDKKAAVGNGKLLTKSIPTWLTVVDGKIVEVPEKVALVKAVFAHAANGLGAKKIRKALNGSATSTTWISKTLRNRAVLGEFQPHRGENSQRVPDGEMVFGYYPRIISDKEWKLARAEVDRKNSIDTETRKLTHGATNSDRAENLFTGLIFDTTTEPVRSMWFQRKKRGNAFFVSSCQTAGMTNHRIRYDRFEKAFLSFLSDLDWKAVSGEGEPEELKVKVAKLTEVTNDLATAKARCAAREAAMADEMDVAMLRVLAAQLAKFEAQVADLETAHEAIAHEVESLRAKLATMDSQEELLALISDTANNDVRLRLRTEIRRRVSRIELNFGQDGFNVVAEVKFINGIIRGFVITDKVTLVIRAEGTI